ncbi:MAG: hypothetical protein OEV44_11555 [Spirochaetota bacterium]|nr:hypothetical protein [Spirochaetota bacterium]
MSNHDEKEIKTPGTFVLAIIFLVWFIVIYFVQWLALSDVWNLN